MNPSPEALKLADALIDDLQDIAGKSQSFYAPCLRDDLEDHREWVRVEIAKAFDRVADLTATAALAIKT